MTDINEGVQGAKVQSWRKANPRDLLKQIVDDNPGASKATIHNEVARKLLADEDALSAVIEYWFTNNYNSLTDQRFAEPPAIVTQRRAAQVASIAKEVEQKIKREAAILLLDMIMPNGSPLRECTGADCKHLSAALGSWLEMVADRLKPNQRVGDHLDEAELKKIYAICASR